MAPPAPLTLTEWLKSQEFFVRAVKGEDVELPDVDPGYGCATCQDTAFIVEKDDRGITTSRRCPICRPSVDAEIKRNKLHAVVDVPDDVAPPVERDWKKLSGLDQED